jgi:hypothetical protein
MARTLRSTAFALVLLLAAGSAQALPLGGAPVLDSNSAGVVETVWQWLTSWFAPADGLAASWQEQGIEIDPNGGDGAGSDLDPHGGTSGVDGDEGSCLDPHG